MNWRKAWLLPLVFLLGYICAWCMILVDRHMLLEEQSRLQEEIDQVRIELKISNIIDEYGDDWQEMILWNEEAIEPLREGK